MLNGTLEIAWNAHAAPLVSDETLLPLWVTLPMFSEWIERVGEAKGNDCRFTGKLYATVLVLTIVPAVIRSHRSTIP